MNKTMTEYVMRQPAAPSGYSMTLPKLPSKNEMRFCFHDGTFATFKDAGSLQEFLDKLARFHELEKDLEIARKALGWLGNNRLAENPVRVEQLRQYARNALELIEHKE